MMYSTILSLICTVWIFLVPCAARVIVSDTDIEGEDLQISLAAIFRADLNAAEARSTPVDSALRQLNVHEKALPSRARAVERRANEPRETQPATHAGVAARQLVIEYEYCVPCAIGNKRSMHSRRALNRGIEKH
ncbi:hypothetical protein BD769DRAFT_1384737 [Suillus cothurnatus]|nr:hypothetical protein BD769DRAFT_1384737 [Suillus cothurnatus]